jgi:hypothetical protein
MSTKFAFFGLALVAGVTQAVAQGVGDGVILTGGLGPVSSPAAPVQTTYSPPVVYQAPLVLQTPVVYQAPGCLVPAYTALSGGYYNPNVIYFGGPNSCYRNYYSGCQYPPNVLYFGRGQAYYQGYHFTACR